MEGFIEDPNAKKLEEGRVRVQRVWIYEDDYKQFGITDDCKKCLHNQRWGYNASRMTHTEKCRRRMEEALATTDEGKQRLATAEERTNQRLAKHVEEADVRPERGIGAEAGPDISQEVSGDVATLAIPERTPIDEWIAEDEMEFENGDQVPQSPNTPGSDDGGYEPTSPAESEADMDTGMVELLHTCSGSEEIRRTVQRDAE